MTALRQESQTTAPILVTGLHRSGTTWVGKALSQSREVSYLHEPFNHAIWPRLVSPSFDCNYTYVCAENASQYHDSVADMLRYRFPLRAQIGEVRSLRGAASLGRSFFGSVARRISHRRPLLKDPMALFSTEWLADEFDASVVVMIRHPAAFASSLKRLNWQFPFRTWLDQPLLMRDHLSGFRGEMEQLSAGDHDIIDQAILLWRAGNSFVRGLQARHSNWLFLRCEDLAEQPVETFRTLYRDLDLTFDATVAGRVGSYSEEGNLNEVPLTDRGTVRRNSKAAKWTWTKRLTPEEVVRVREGVADVSAWFYGDADWEAPKA